MKYALANLVVLGSFCVLGSLAYGRAAPSTPVHTVVQRPTQELDMSPVSRAAMLRWDTGYSHAAEKSNMLRKTK